MIVLILVCNSYQILNAVRQWVAASREDIRSLLSVSMDALNQSDEGESMDYWTVLPNPLEALKALELYWLTVIGGMERMMASELRGLGFLSVS